MDKAFEILWQTAVFTGTIVFVHDKRPGQFFPIVIGLFFGLINYKLIKIREDMRERDKREQEAADNEIDAMYKAYVERHPGA